MNIIKNFLWLLCLSLLLISVHAAPSATPKDLRAKAEAMIKKQQDAESNEESYKKIDRLKVPSAYIEAFNIYTDLLKTTNDENSGTDLTNLLKVIKSLRHYNVSEDVEKELLKKLSVIPSSYPFHEKNNKYLASLWLATGSCEDFFRTFIWFPNSLNITEEIYRSDYARLHEWARFNLGEKILTQGPGNLDANDYSFFLLNYARSFCKPLNDDELPAYGFFHKLTPFTPPHALGRNLITNLRNSKDYTLLDKTGLPITYTVPTSWASATNDGQRVAYLLSEAVRINPACEIHARALRASFYHEALTPQNAFKEYFKPANILPSLPEELNNFLPLYQSLELNQTIVLFKNKLQVLTLPENMNYIKELKAISYGNSSPSSDDSAEYSKTQKDAAHAQHNISTLFLNELITRLRYSEALNEAKSLLASPLYATNESKEKRHILEEIIAQISGSKAYFPTISNPHSYHNTKEVKIPLIYRNSRSIELSFYKINTDYLMSLARDGKDNLEKRMIQGSINAVNPALLECQNLYKNPETGKNLLTQSRVFTFPLNPLPGHKDTLDLLHIPSIESGYYLVEGRVEGQKIPSYRFISVSPLQINSAKTKDGMAIFVSNTTTGEPRKEAEINILSLISVTDNSTKKNSITTEDIKLTTDENGKVLIPYPSNEATQELLVSVKSQDDVAYVRLTNNSFSQVEHGNKSAALIVTDRPVYRPGQTVYWTAWLGKTDYEKGSEFLANTPVKVKFNGIQKEASMTSDDKGILKGTFIIPESAKLQTYHLEVTSPDSEGKDNHYYGSTAFSVEDYKKENLILNIDTGKKYFSFREKVTVTLDVRYYSGEPVNNGTAEIIFSGDMQPLPPATSLVIKDGKAVFEFSPPLPPDTTSQSCYLDINATVKDDSLRQVQQNASIVISSQKLESTIKLDTNYGHSGEGMSGKASLRTVNDAPVSTQGDATLYLLTLNEKSKKQEKRKALSWNITTNSKGETSLRFLPPGAGYYELELKFPLDSTKSKFITDTHQFYVLPKEGETITPFPLPRSGKKLIPYKDQYKIGETAQVLLVSDEKTKSVTLFRSLGFSDEETRIVSTPLPLTETKWAIEAKHAPSFYISLFDQNQRTITSDFRINVLRQTAPPLLQSSLGGEALKDNIPALKPGLEEKLTVSVTDKAGAPAANIPVVISVYDKALERFSRESIINSSSPFWATTRPYTFTGHSGNNPSFPTISNYQLLQYGFEMRTEEYKQNINLLMSQYVAYAYTIDNILPPRIDTQSVLIPTEGSTPPSFIKKDKNLLSTSSIYEQGSWSRFFRFYPLTSIYNPPGTLASFDIDPESIGLGADLYAAGPFARFQASPPPRSIYMMPAMAPTKSEQQETQQKASEQPSIRKNFKDLLKWSGTVFTDEKGNVTLPLTMPDNLTTWRVIAGAVNNQLETGVLKAEFRTTQDLIAELHTPRFLVEKDSSRLTAVVRNNSDEQDTLEVSLGIKGDALVLLPNIFPEKQSVTLPPKSSVALHWQTLATGTGEVTLTLTAKGEKLGDASEQTLPLIIRGAYKGESFSKILTPGQTSVSGTLNFPKEVEPELSQINLQVSPGLAPVIAKALPYLKDYPYSCIEQTMNRFIPALVATDTLGEGLINKDDLEHITRESFEKLYSGNNGNGGWGWFAGSDSSPYITAQVVRGLLQIPETSPVHADADTLVKKALSYLKQEEEKAITLLSDKKEKKTASATDVYVHMVLLQSGNKDLHDSRMTNLLIRDRHSFSPYSLSQLALILHLKGEKTVLNDIQKNLKTIRKSDKDTGTAWLALAPKRFWWMWEYDDIETQIAYLNLLTATDPNAEATRGLARWIASNREHSYYWKSTRDTGLAIEALCRYIKATNEGTTPLTLDVLAGGEVIHTIDYDPSQASKFDGSISIPSSNIAEGENKVELRLTKGSKETPIYLTATSKYFSQEDRLTASGSDLKVTRTIKRIVNDKTTSPLADGDTLISGDIIEVTLSLEARNDYQYIMVRDPKPAGCEPYHLTSGYRFDPRADTHFLRSYYSELADRETRFFLEALPKGSRTLTYKLRVERPGTYTALPTQIEAMYAPVLRGNSDEQIIDIQPPDTLRKEDTPKENPEELIGQGDESTQEAFDMAFRARIGWGQPINHPVAMKWLKKAASDHIPALYSIARWTLQQKSNPDKEAEAKEYIKKALSLVPQNRLSQDGDVLAAMGKLYTMDDAVWDKEFAADFPDIKDRRQYGIGLLKRASLLYEKAAQEGSGYAAYRLGLLYQGEGIFLSPKKALEYYKMGAKFGFAPALYEAAKLTPDNEESEAWLRQAIASKFYPAAELLAERLFARRNDQGETDAKTTEEALKLLELAAQEGCPRSQLSMATLYEKGKLLPKDNEKAQFWHSLATDGHYIKEELTEKTELPIIDAIDGKHLPDRDILPLSNEIKSNPLPEALPYHSSRVDGLTDGELIKKWEGEQWNALPELAKRFAIMDDPVAEVESELQEYLPESVMQYNSLARQGDTQAALDLAKILNESDFPQDKQLAQQWLQLLAKDKHAQALRALAMQDYLGMDPEKGVDILIKLAERNDLSSILDLKDTFGNTGRGGELNLARAKAYQAQFDDVHNLKHLLSLVNRDVKNEKASKAALLSIVDHIILAAEEKKEEDVVKEAKKTLGDLEKRK